MTASKQKGTAFENVILTEARIWYPGAERRALAGKLDKGDLNLPGEDRYIIECKNVSRFNLAEWMHEAEVEAGNAGVRAGVVAHKRRGVGAPGEQWITTTARHFFYLVHTAKGAA